MHRISESADKTLILIPTESEAAHIQSNVMQLRSEGAIVEHCGFGPIVAAARTLQAISEHRPRNVFLLGIAGAYQAETQLGSAFEFGEVVCYGVGVGSTSNFRSASQLGWQQWPGSDQADGDPRLSLQQCIEDRIQLRPCTTHKTETLAASPRQLLSCCSAAGSEADVQLRRSAYPSAFAEDMEGFGVAAACHLGGVPLRIIRGISNRVGQRDFLHWKIAEAMQAAFELFMATRHST